MIYNGQVGRSSLHVLEETDKRSDRDSLESHLSLTLSENGCVWLLGENGYENE